MRTPLLAISCLILAASALAADEPPLRVPPDRAFDVKRIALDLVVDLEQRSIDGSATLHLAAVRDLRALRLDAVGHEVSAVHRLGPDGGAGAPVPFSYDGEALTVDLELTRGEAASLRVTYRVRDPKDGLHFYGPTPGAPDTPWQVWSQGESVTNRYWFPCVDHPDERQATAITARVKKGLTVISNGSLVEKTDDPKDPTRTMWRYEQDREHVSYLVSLVVGTFDVVEDTWRGKRVAYYVPVGRKADALRSFGRTKDMLDFFSDATGVEYPWVKYEQIVVEQFESGGMENTGVTTLNERTLHDERAHLDYSSEGLVAHELAHQWFGDLITCRDWSHIWLNESFATYFDALWHEKSQGPDVYDLEVLDNADAGIRGGKDRPIVDRRYPSPDAMFDNRAYPKGGSVLHMLRRLVGDAAWWRGIKLHLTRNGDRSVETVDLRRCMEEAAGRNLERFFWDWTERPGNPSLDVSVSRDAERGLLSITVKQTQQGEPYVLPVELLLRFGKREVRHTLDVTGREATLVLPEREAPTLCVVDPREALVLCERTVRMGQELWFAQLREGPTASSRLRAARALADDRSPAARDALGRSLAEDPFWGVRKAAAEALAGHDEAGRDILLTAATEQKDARVRRAAVGALRERGRDAKTAAAMAALLEKGDPSYYVEAEAIRTLARAGEAPRAALEKQLSKPSHNEVIRIAAIESLAGLSDPTLVPLCLQLMAGKEEYALRQSAARALGSVAALPGASDADRKAAVEALRAMLRTSYRRGRRAALDGLSALGGLAKEAAPDVQAVARTDPQGGIRRQADGVLARLQREAAPEGELSRLREETAALRQARERLEERMTKLEAEARQRPTATPAPPQ